MFNFLKPKCLLNPQQKDWLDGAWATLSDMFDLRLRTVPVILPTPEFFPGHWVGSDEDVERLVSRVSTFMGVRSPVVVETFDDVTPGLAMKGLNQLSMRSSGAAGTYHDHEGTGVIRIAMSQVQDPMGLVATLAHELGHVLLLGERRVPRDREDHEPLTDLLTVTHGLGIFTANSAFRMTSSDRGWQYSRLGYLGREMFAHALALFALARQETKPAWLLHVDPLVAGGVRDSIRYLLAQSTGK